MKFPFAVHRGSTPRAWVKIFGLCVLLAAAPLAVALSQHVQDGNPRALQVINTIAVGADLVSVNVYTAERQGGLALENRTRFSATLTNAAGEARTELPPSGMSVVGCRGSGTYRVTVKADELEGETFVNLSCGDHLVLREAVAP